MKHVWFGLFDVKPTRGNSNVLDGAKGAYVNALALASNSEEFKQLVSVTLNEFGFDVLSIENVNLFDQLKRSGHEFEEEILDLELQLSEDEPVQFDEFQAYLND